MTDDRVPDDDEADDDTTDDDTTDDDTTDDDTTDDDTGDDDTGDDGTTDDDTGDTDTTDDDTGDDDTGDDGLGTSTVPLDQTGPRPWGKVAAVAGAIVIAIGGFQLWSVNNERNDLVAQVADLEESLADARGDLGGQIERLEADNQRLVEQTDQLEGLLSTTLAEIEENAAEIERLIAQLAERDAEIEELQAIVDITGTEIELMPDLLGLTIEEVREIAAELGVVLIELEAAPGNVIARPGDIIDQAPIEDTPLLPGSVVWVEVFTPIDAAES